ncbi:MAG: DUF2958 domain-containing protein [Ignavibacteriae bacterium]|nr:DUF2958 domain-containing protein [Ignavibacteriota bacterium]MCB0725236.1 DUF2958 domain-containing protein [Ignavibacteriota bacterium]MCB9242440.1 DUF2958 domain-containing protein [Ignavibacteriales bacterium]
MKLFTSEIEDRAQKQYPLANDLDNQIVVAKFFNPIGSGTWYLVNQDPEDPNYCWGIADLFCVEVGSFSKSDLENTRLPFGLKIERDLYFDEVNAGELYRKLLKEENN